ncbi:MAG: hypothetical protein QHH80_09435 [Anaerolineae bacterium]|jgi:hypothetical protein|nr:hypothetical protein [Anaerolineae bacterium]
MSKVWVKLYVADLLDDPKLADLSWEHRGILAALLALAGKLDHRDESGAETGRLDTLAHVAWHIRCGTEQLAEAVAVLERCGLVEQRDGALYLVDYASRQCRPPSASREAVAERVRRFREAQAASCSEDVTRAQRAQPPQETESEPEADADGEAASATEAAAAVSSDGEGAEFSGPCAECAAEADDRLARYGVEARVAWDLICEFGPRRVLFWCAHAATREAHLQNPAGLIIDRLRRGLDPPLPDLNDGVWRIVCCEACAGDPPVSRSHRNTGYGLT